MTIDNEQYYILDTNVLLYNPQFINHNKVIILPIVLRELENLEKKRTNQHILYQIRQAKRVIKQSDNVYYLIDDGAEHELVERHTDYDPNYGDNIILAYAKALSEGSFPDELPDFNYDNLIVYTDDILLGLKCNAHGIKTVSSSNYGDENTSYEGVKVWEYDSTSEEHQDKLNSLYKSDYQDNVFDLQPNEYLLIVDKQKGLGEEMPSDVFIYRNEHHYSVMRRKNTISNPNNDGTDIVALNMRQNIAINALNDERSLVKIIKGKVASGKSYLTFSKAKELLDNGTVERIVFIGNSVTEKSSSDIGFLPGSSSDKIGHSYSYISDVLGSPHLLEEMLFKEQIIVEYCGFIRSRTFSNSAIVVSEAQNFTIEQLELILTRVGEGSYLIIDGDYNQSDINDSGFERFVNKLRVSELVSVVTLTEIERSEVAELSELLKG